MIDYVMIFLATYALILGIWWVFAGMTDTYMHIVSAVIAAVLAFPINSFFDWAAANKAVRVAERVEHERKWEETFSKDGCKRTDYVTVKDKLHEVWRCPDGVAHIRQAP